MPAGLTIGRFLDEDEIDEELRELDVYTEPISFEELSGAVKDLPNVRFKPDKKNPPSVKFRFEELEVYLTKEEFGEPVDRDDWYKIFSWDEVDGTISFNARTTTMKPDDTVWKIAIHIANATDASIIDDDGSILYTNAGK